MEKISQNVDSLKSGNRKNEVLKIIALPVLILMLIFYSPQLNAQDNHGEQDNVLLYENGEVEWKDGPASFEAGSQFAVLEGDPGKEGYFNLRLKLPDGFRIAPHWHPNIERVTVISGNFLLGHGESADRNATQNLGPGSYVSLPPEMIHYAIADGETVVQLTTIGPWQIHYVRDEDDPRKR